MSTTAMHAPVLPGVDPFAPVKFREWCNMKTMRQGQDLLPLRMLKVGHISWATVVQNFIARTTRVGSYGWFDTQFVDNSRSVALDLPGRMYNLVDNNKLDGMSSFGLPRILQELFRIGMPMANMDQVSAHFQSLKDLVMSWSSTDSDYPNIFAIAADRKGYQARCAILGKTDGDMKVLLISIAYQCERHHSWPQALRDLHFEISSVVHRLARQQPEKLKLVRSWGKKRPAVTLLSYYLCHYERLDMDRMIVAAGTSAMTPEFDGLVLFTTPDGHGLQGACDRVRQAAQRQLALKPYAKTFEEWIEHAMVRYPHEDWGRTSRFPWQVVQEASRSVDYYLEPDEVEEDKTEESAGDRKKPKAKTKHLPADTDMATLVAADLEGTVLLSKGVHWFDGISWVAIDELKGVHSLVKASMQTLFRTGIPYRLRQTNGKTVIIRAGFPAPFAKDHGKITTVRMEVSSDLLGPTPDFDVHRHFLAFKNGKTLDLRSLKLVDTHPNMMLEKTLDWDGQDRFVC